MTQKAVNNAKVLYRLNISRSDVEEAHKIFTKAPFLLETLTNPVVSEEAKEVVLDKIARQSGMPELLENFMKMMCRICLLYTSSSALTFPPCFFATAVPNIYVRNSSCEKTWWKSQCR